MKKNNFVVTFMVMFVFCLVGLMKAHSIEAFAESDNYQTYDLNSDSELDVFDLLLLKNKILNNTDMFNQDDVSLLANRIVGRQCNEILVDNDERAFWKEFETKKVVKVTESMMVLLDDNTNEEIHAVFKANTKKFVENGDIILDKFDYNQLTYFIVVNKDGDLGMVEQKLYICFDSIDYSLWNAQKMAELFAGDVQIEEVLNREVVFYNKYGKKQVLILWDNTFGIINEENYFTISFTVKGEQYSIYELDNKFVINKDTEVGEAEKICY